MPLEPPYPCPGGTSKSRTSSLVSSVPFLDPTAQTSLVLLGKKDDKNYFSKMVITSHYKQLFPAE